MKKLRRTAQTITISMDSYTSMQELFTESVATENFGYDS